MNRFVFRSLPFFLTLFTLLVAESEEEAKKQYEAEYAAYQSYIGDVSDLRFHFAEQMEKEFGLRFSGTSGCMHGTIKDIGIHFEAERRATIEEARALLLLVMDRFVEAINKNEKLKPFLDPQPFTHRNVSIKLSFKGINGSHTDGTVCWMFNVSDFASPSCRNRLVYFSMDPFSKESIELLEESYEEAVERNKAAAIQTPAVHQGTEQEELFDQFFYSFKEEMEKKYHFECWSIGGKLTDGMEEIGAKFVLLHSANQEKARKLMIDTAHELLDALNNNESLQPYMKEKPFPIDRLRLRICFKKKRTYSSYGDGTMESVTLDNGQMTYFQDYLDGTRVMTVGVPVYATESYQEAVQVLEKSGQPKWSFKDAIKSFFGLIPRL